MDWEKREKRDAVLGRKLGLGLRLGLRLGLGLGLGLHLVLDLVLLEPNSRRTSNSRAQESIYM